MKKLHLKTKKIREKGNQLNLINIIITTKMKYTQKYYQKWSERYDIKMVSLAVAFDFKDSEPLTGLFHWNINGKLSDPDNYYQKSAKEILRDLFGE